MIVLIQTSPFEDSYRRLLKNTPVTVYLAGTNDLAALWANSGGTIASPNPTTTDGYGNLIEVYAEEGLLDLSVNGVRERIQTYGNVTAAIAALVGSSPALLDTLNELAAALGNDPNFATTVNNALAARLTEVQGDARYRRLTSLIAAADLAFDPATQVELDATQLAASARSYRPASIVYLGDSVTARGGQFESGSRAVVGYTTWTQVFTNERLRPLYNAGIAGETIGQIAARLQVDVITRAPGVCVILAGINDIKGAPATSLATMQETMISMLDQTRTAGILAIVCTIPGSDLLDLASEKAQWQAWNRWLLGLGSDRSGVRVCNIAPYVTNPASVLWATGFSDDGTHENVVGAIAMAIPLADVIDGLFPPRSSLGAGVGDTEERMPNPNMTGNVAGAATGVAIIGGTLSKVPRADGIIGEWQQWTTAASTTGTILQDVIGTGLVAGDKVRAEIEFEADPGWIGVTNFFFSIEDRSSANVIIATQYDFGPAAIPNPRSGIMRSNPLTLIDGYRVRVLVRIVTGAGSSAVLRIGRMSLRKV